MKTVHCDELNIDGYLVKAFPEFQNALFIAGLIEQESYITAIKNEIKQEIPTVHNGFITALHAFNFHDQPVLFSAC
jgi:hypothetical protein